MVKSRSLYIWSVWELYITTEELIIYSLVKKRCDFISLLRRSFPDADS